VSRLLSTQDFTMPFIFFATTGSPVEAYIIPVHHTMDQPNKRISCKRVQCLCKK